MAKVAQKYFWWGALSAGEQGEFVSLTKNNDKEPANAEIAEHRSLRETKITTDPYQRPIRFLPDKAYLSSFIKKTETVSPVDGSTTYNFKVRGPDNRRLRNFKKRLAEVKEGHHGVHFNMSNKH
ncbi:hypothetical protein N0V88_001572 [Collariella sp. IMI 366227]|nr:hypothetical protein N0V88_001572 [Collariella sp. IMI 366227]